MAEPPTGTVTFLFTDLEGSTRLWEQHPEVMKSALARHDAILQDAVENHDGVVVKTRGDGLHAVFSVASDAVAAALDAQLALTREEWALPDRLRVRMGLHTGVAEVRAGDYFGTAVNRAARVASAAHGGQVVASAATADLVRDELALDVTLLDLGEHRLRDLGRPERLVQVGRADLPRDFPPLRSLDAYPGNLPVQRTSFVGRAADLVEVRAALEAVRVLTLTGVGGVGKTRLALQAAAETVAAFRDGAWFVDFGPVLDAGFVAAACRAALLLPERRQGTVEDSVVAGLRDKELLVVLDNCEHVVGEVAALVDLVVDSCPAVRCLATSREALGVEGEATFQVRPLSIPAELGDGALGALLDNDAMRLFVERAQMVKRGFALSEESGPVVAEICRRLDGIPLAVELAAARLQLLGPSDILSRLDERFRLLAGAKRAGLERQQTLRGAIDWSYELLDPAEQLLFARMSVFAGGFTLEAAEAVGEGEGVDVLALLASLIAKSMVVTDDTGTGVRYRLLETLRDYAAERLAELDDPVAVRARHAAHFLTEVETAGPMLRGADDEAAVSRLAAEQDNLRAALGWARAQSDPAMFVRLVRGLGFYWIVAGPFREATQWLDAAGLERAADFPAEVRAELLTYAAVGENGLGHVDEAIRLLEESIACSRDAGLPPQPSALSMLGVAALESNHPEEAIAQCEEAVGAAREFGDSFAELHALNMLAVVCSLTDAERGRALADEAVAGSRELGNIYLLGTALQAAGIARVGSEPELAIRLLEEAEQLTPSRNEFVRSQSPFFRGIAYIRLGQIAAAAGALRAALRHTQALGSDYFSANVITASAALLARTEPGTAVQLLGALERIRAQSRVEGAPADVESRRITGARLEQLMDPSEFTDAWALGAEMSIDDAAAFTDAALATLET
jgi:predicted ATPase/class 3 adenylate cyclase